MRRLLAATALSLVAACAAPKEPVVEGAGPVCCAPPKADGAGAPQSPAAPATAAAPAANPAAALEEAKQKVEDTSIQLDLATTRLDRARMDAEQQQLDAGLATEKSRVELGNAQKALDHFVRIEMPQKRSRAELDLTQAKDYLTEQQEELQQLELMYQKDDLADKTKEIVLARSKRRLERAVQSIMLQSKDFDDLVNVQQPEQRTKLELAARDREADVRRADFNAKSGQIDKQMAVRTQEIEVARLKREVEKARKAAEPAATGTAEPKTSSNATSMPESSVASFLFGHL